MNAEIQYIVPVDSQVVLINQLNPGNVLMTFEPITVHTGDVVILCIRKASDRQMSWINESLGG